MTIDVGSELPDFTLPTDGGETLSKADLAGKPFVLYLYPKDDTSGCTKEALAFQELYDRIGGAGAELLGLSKDSVKSHDKFKAKHGLTFPLLSDEEGGLVEALGAWVEKNMYGKKYMGIDRSTFLIDDRGVVRSVWRKVKVPGHAEKVVAELEKMRAPA
ncbi:MAG: peroxiredoxin [Geminicoccaceae bacterium]